MWLWWGLNLSIRDCSWPPCSWVVASRTKCVVGDMQRRLAAILAADVVGYSRLIAENEADTFDRLQAHRKELYEPEIPKQLRPHLQADGRRPSGRIRQGGCGRVCRSGTASDNIHLPPDLALLPLKTGKRTSYRHRRDGRVAPQRKHVGCRTLGNRGSACVSVQSQPRDCVV
jgi:hypothetical protein